MSLNDLQKASLRSGIYSLGQVINPDTGEPLSVEDLGTTLEGIEDVPGLVDALAAKISASLLTVPGSIIMLPGVLNYATAAQGASASSIDGGNDGVPADLLDGNDSTGFNSFNFSADRILIDLGQARTIASVRLVQTNGLTNTVEHGPSSSGPWTKVVDAQAAGGGSPKVSIYSFTAVSARYWRFTPNTVVGGNLSNWKTIECRAPQGAPVALPPGTVGQVLKIGSDGIPAWAADAT